MANGFMNPQNQFLMTAGAHLMGQPYSPVPQSTFSGLGNAFDQGMGAYQNALILQEKQREAEEKRQAMAAAQAAKEARAAQFQQAISNLPPDRKQALANWYAVDEPGAVKALYDMYTPAEVDNKMGDSAMDSAILSLGLDTKPRNQWTPADIQAVSTEADRIRKLNSPPPAAAPDPYGDALVGLDMKYIEQMNTEAEGAAARLDKINVIKELNKIVDSGSIAAPAFARLQGVMSDFGIPIAENSEVAAKEALLGLQTSLVLDERTYGPRDSRFTDADMKLYQEVQGGLSNTKEGREFITTMLEDRFKTQLTRQEEFDDKVAEYEDQGMPRSRAIQLAVADSRRAKRERAKSGDGQFVKADGTLTELGQKLQSMATNVAGGRSSSGNATSNLPVMSEQEAAGLNTYNSTAEGDASGDAMYIVNGVVYQR